MRGGNTDATLVVGDGPIAAPPTVSATWSALALHPAYWPPVRRRLRPGGFVLVDATVFREPVDIAGATVLAVEATGIASELGLARASSMVAIGAFVAATGLVTEDAVIGATAKVLPSYRAEHAADNARAVQAGMALVPEVLAAAWMTEAGSVRTR